MAQSVSNQKLEEKGFHDAFISYGRKESKAFALRLHNQLSELGYNIWLDQDDIPLGVDFQDQIDKGIENAHNFIYIIAPHANNSAFCRKEVELAIKYKKRIIPILHVEEELDKLHPEIGKINWLYMREVANMELPQEEWKSIDNYDNVFQGLVNLISTDKAYIEQHTQLLKKALNWQRNQYENKFLLVGKERQDAEKWLLKAVESDQTPVIPSDLHCEFISEAKKNAENLMTDVFISYASENSELRDRIKNALSHHIITTWVHNKDIRSGQDFAVAINEGIEQADSLIFFISNESLQSEYCIKELNYALELNKRIIPILIEKEINYEQPAALASLQYIDFTAHEQIEHFSSKINELVGRLNEDRRYYQQHKIFLAQALKWQKQEQNPSILLRGYNLQNAQAWIKIGKKRASQKPIALQEEFIEASTSQTGQQNIEVFVSYSRTDGDFARKVNEQLQLNGKTTWFDQESIAEGSDFQKEIEKGIETSDNFLFIISPEAVQSEYCANEVAYASQLNKRFVTVFYRDTDPKTMPLELSSVQWINFKELDFHTAFSQLIRTLDTDREHLQAHTKWQRRAMEWNENDRDKSRLLRGNEFTLAEVWLHEAQENNKKPEATALQEEFISESKKAIFASQLKEKKTNQRLKIFLAASIIALLFAIAGGLYAVKKGYEAKEHAKIALEKEQKATQAEKEAKEAYDQVSIAVKKAEDAQKETLKTLEELQSKEKQLENALIVAKRNGEIAKQNELEAEISRVRAEIEALHMKNFSKVIRIAKSDPTIATSALQLINKRAEKDEFKEFIYDIFSKNYLYSHNLKDHHAQIYAVKSSPDGQNIISGGRDSRARIWNKNGHPVYVFYGHSSTVLGIDITPQNKVITGSWDKKALVWDLNGKVELTLEHDNPVWSVAASNDGKHYLTGTSDSLAFLWDDTGKKLLYFTIDGTAWGVEFSPDGQSILITNGSKASLWDISGNFIRSFQHNETVYKAVFSPDGTKVLTGSWDRTTKLWNLDGTLIHTYDSDYTYSVDFSPNGKLILTAGNDTDIKIWDLNGHLVKTLKGHTKKIRSAVFSGDNNNVISGSDDETVKFWPMTGRVEDDFISKKYVMNGFEFSPDGTKVLYANTNNIATLRNIQTGEEIQLSHHTNYIKDVAFSPTGDTLVTAGKDKQIVLWSSDGKFLNSFNDKAEIKSISYAPDGKTIISANTSKDISIWTNKGKLKKRITAAHMEAITTLEISPKNNMFLTTSADKTAILWTMNGDIINTFSDYNNYIFFGTFSPNGKQILLGGKNNTAQLYDLKGNLQQVFRGHSSYVITCAFSPDGSSIATGSTDRSVKLWSLEGNLFKSIEDHKDIVNSIVFSKNGKYMLTASDDGQVYIRHKISEPLEYIEQSKLADFNATEYAKAGIIDITDYINLEKTADLIALSDTYIEASKEKESNSEKEDMLYSAFSIIKNIEDKSKQLDNSQLQQVYLKAAEAHKLLGENRSSYSGTFQAGISSFEESLEYFNKVVDLGTPSIEVLHSISTILNYLEIGYTSQYQIAKAADVKLQEINILEKIAVSNPYELYINNKIAEAYSSYAYVLLKLKNNKEAVGVMKNLCKRYPDKKWLDVRLATTLLFNGEQSEAYKIIESRKDDEYIVREPLFTDNFDDNSQNWWTGTGNNAASIENGNYIIERTINRNGLFYRGISINTQKDFEIETSFKIARGVQNNSFSLDFGSNVDEYNTFGVSGDGYYVIRSIFDGEWQTFKPWINSKAVKRNDYNKLTVRKIADKLYFFVNESMVHSMPFDQEKWFGEKIGFTVQDTSVLNIDFLYVSQLEVEKPLNELQKNSVQNSNWINQYHYTFKDKFREEFTSLAKDDLHTSALYEAKKIISEIDAVSLSEKWDGIPYSSVDAAIYWPDNQKAYFFKGDNYIRFDIISGTTDSGYPKNTPQYWPGINFSKIDASCYWYENNHSYFFSGDQFILYDVIEDKAVDGYPKKIDNTTWPGLTFSVIDAAVSLKNGKTYFFSGNQYIRFDRKKHRADPGYPKKLNTDNWFGLEFERIDAAISVGDNIIQLISGDKSDTWNVEKSN